MRAVHARGLASASPRRGRFAVSPPLFARDGEAADAGLLPAAALGGAGGAAGCAARRAALLRFALRAAALSALAAGFVYATLDLARDGPLALALHAYLRWTAAGGFEAALVFALVYALCVVAMVPELALWLGGGFAFGAAYGPAAGTAVAAAAAMAGQLLGNTAAFVLGRALLGGCLARAARRFALARAVDAALRDDAAALRILLLLRLSPLTPNQLLNYLLAGTALRLRPFAAATLAMAPSIVCFSALGAAVTALADATRGQAGGPPALALALAAAGGVATLAAIALLAVYTRRQLRAALAAAAADAADAAPGGGGAAAAQPGAAAAAADGGELGAGGALQRSPLSDGAPQPPPPPAPAAPPPALAPPGIIHATNVAR